MNSATFIGNLCANAVQRQAQDGKLFITFDIAVNEGKNVPPVYVSCAKNGDNAKLLPYLEKGKKVYVRGRITARTYNSTKDGQTHAYLALSVYELELISASGNATQQVQQQVQQVQADARPQPTTAKKAPKNIAQQQPQDVKDLPF